MEVELILLKWLSTILKQAKDKPFLTQERILILARGSAVANFRAHVPESWGCTLHASHLQCFGTPQPNTRHRMRLVVLVPDR